MTGPKKGGPSVPTTNPPKGTTTVVMVPVKLSNASLQTVTVRYATQNQTAIAGTDYVATSGTLTFDPGTTTSWIPVTILSARGTNNKQFAINLSSPVNASIAVVNGVQSRGIVQIYH